jgi:predicted TIM-barrel fold metal-dependent hydrolase
MALDIVDAQVHFTTLGIAEGLAAMDALGISSLLIDEFDRVDGDGYQPYVLTGNGIPRPVQPMAEAAARRHPERLAYLMRVDYRDPDLDALVAQEMSAPGFKALRTCALLPDEQIPFATGAYREVFAVAARHTIPLFVNALELEAVDQYIEAFTEVPIILDHCGTAYTAQKFDHLIGLARYSNLHIKWTHGPAIFGSPDYPFVSLQEKLRELVDAFGADRILWASDITENHSGHTWAEMLFQVRDSSLLSGAEKTWILGSTARKVLGWPKAGPEPEPVPLKSFAQQVQEFLQAAGEQK